MQVTALCIQKSPTKQPTLLDAKSIWFEHARQERFFLVNEDKNIIFIVLSMRPQQKEILSFFHSVNQLPCSLVDSPYVVLSSFFISGPNSTQKKIVLKEGLLLVSNGEDERSNYGILLEEVVRFRQLREEGRLRGFRLFNAFNHYVDIRLVFEELGHLWVQQLGRLINQEGFNEEFQLVRKIGRGSTANVYEVTRRHDGRLFAAKVVLKSYLRQRKERAQALAQEVEILRTVEHQNIIRLQAVFECQQAVYLIFKRLTGGTLLERLNCKKGLSLNEVRIVMRGVIQAIAYLHRFGIAHRDLKLQNILLLDEYSLQPVIADFGLAVLPQQQPYLYYRCGTPGYVAPEIIRMRRKRQISVACDIFSAGAIFHLLLTNSLLFSGKNAEEVYQRNKEADFSLSGHLYDELDPSALKLLKKMLVVRPSQRISAEEILEQQFLLLPEQQDQKQEVSPAATDSGVSYPF